MRSKVAILFATGLVALFAAFAGDARESSATVGSNDGCDRYASEGGSNADTGTFARPFASAKRLSDSLRPGQTGCFFEGTYSEPDRRWFIAKGGASGEPVTLKSVPGEKATYSGWMAVDDAADYLVVRNMNIDGSTAPQNKSGWAQTTVTVRGDNVSFLNNNVTNRNRGVCFLLGQAGEVATDALIQDNKIHHCGELPATNHQHGIYATNSKNARILDNWIYKNADRGIQLYPSADNTLIAGNVIDRNGQGVLFSGAGDRVSDGNVLRNNIISNSRIRWNVTSNYNQTSLVGRGNTVRENCVWASNRDDYYNRYGGVERDVPGYTALDNPIAEPQFVDQRGGNLGLRNPNPCRAALDG